MNKFTVTFEIETSSPDPEDWITEAVIDQLDPEEGETITYLKVVRTS